MINLLYTLLNLRHFLQYYL